MAAIHITDVEAAINHWRGKRPSPDGVTLAPELRALAEVYALMVYHRADEADERGFPPAAYAAWKAWYDTTPDTPCIAICSTSQGDALCKGCGRTFHEVQHWTEMNPAEKRSTWRRITLQGSAWRFNRYAERGGRLMLRLTQAPNIAIAALWVDALRHAGIEASMQRYYLGAAAGQLPPDQCLPEIWLTHDEQEAQARTLLRDLSQVTQRHWVCQCGETVEGGFEQCWNCGTWMPR